MCYKYIMKNAALQNLVPVYILTISNILFSVSFFPSALGPVCVCDVFTGGATVGRQIPLHEYLR